MSKAFCLIYLDTMQMAATVYSIPVLKWGLATVPMMEEEWSSCGSGEKKQGGK